MKKSKAMMDLRRKKAGWWEEELPRVWLTNPPERIPDTRSLPPFLKAEDGTRKPREAADFSGQAELR